MAINDKKTIPWINVLKALCILLVFFRHCESYLGFECSWINFLIEPIYVNSFFFISGYLLFKKQLTITPKGSLSHYLKGDGKMMISNIFF